MYIQHIFGVYGGIYVYMCMYLHACIHIHLHILASRECGLLNVGSCDPGDRVVVHFPADATVSLRSRVLGLHSRSQCSRRRRRCQATREALRTLLLHQLPLHLHPH